MRLNVYLQKAGIGSRREAERMVAEGRVRINGTVALATMPAEEGDVITLDGKAVAPDTKPRPRLFLAPVRCQSEQGHTAPPTATRAAAPYS